MKFSLVSIGVEQSAETPDFNGQTAPAVTLERLPRRFCVVRILRTVWGHRSCGLAISSIGRRSITALSSRGVNKLCGVVHFPWASPFRHVNVVTSLRSHQVLLQAAGSRIPVAPRRTPALVPYQCPAHRPESENRLAHLTWLVHGRGSRTYPAHLRISISSLHTPQIAGTPRGAGISGKKKGSKFIRALRCGGG